MRNFVDLKAKDGEVYAIWECETVDAQSLTRRLPGDGDGAADLLVRAAS